MLGLTDIDMDPFVSCRKKTQEAKKASLTKSSSSSAAGPSTSATAATAPVRHIPAQSSSLFFSHNTALGPPYRVLVDTNFINFSLQNKIELVQGMMDCLYAESERTSSSLASLPKANAFPPRSHPMHNTMRTSRIRKARPQIPHRATSRSGSTLRKATVQP
jgi:hypothetical protein